MKIVKLSVVLFSTVFLTGLTPDEARLYGSRIIICGDDDTYIRYWTPYMKGSESRNNREDMIFDMSTKKSYTFGECRLYKCSPEPWRMYDCKLPPENDRIKR